MKRTRWTEPELPIGPTDLALVAEHYDAPTSWTRPIDAERFHLGNETFDHEGWKAER